MSTAISTQHVSQACRFDVVRNDLLSDDIQSRWAKVRGKEDSNRIIDSKEPIEGEDKTRCLGELVKMRPLKDEAYAKTAWRKKQAALSPPEKVRQVVAMQKRARPILAARGVIIVHWILDEGENRP